MTRPLRVVPTHPAFAIAVRVSRLMGRGGERFLSPEIQVNASKTAIERVGGVLDVTVGEGGVFYDFDISGGVHPDERPGMGAALELVRSGALSGIVVYDLSRFSRDTAHGLRVLEEIAAAGGQVLSASETIDLDTPSGVFSTTVQLAANRLRRDEASKAWKATHARRFEMGLPHGKLPYGYRNTEGRAEPDPILGPAISAAFGTYALGNATQTELAAHLGILRGRPIRSGTFSTMLRNRFYVGELRLLGEVKQGRHEPLVDEATFAAVQRRLADESGRNPRYRQPATFITGLVFCECGRPLYRQGQQDRPAHVLCAGQRNKDCHGIGTPQVGLLEAALHDLVLDLTSELADTTPAFLVRQSKATRLRSEAKELTAERTSLLNAIGRLGVSLAKGVMDESAYAEGVRQLQDELRTVEARLAVATSDASSAGRPLVELRSAAERIGSLWAQMNPAERRSVVRVILPQGVRVRRAKYRGEPMLDRLIVPD